MTGVRVFPVHWREGRSTYSQDGPSGTNGISNTNSNCSNIHSPQEQLSIVCLRVAFVLGVLWYVCCSFLPTVKCVLSSVVQEPIEGQTCSLWCSQMRIVSVLGLAMDVHELGGRSDERLLESYVRHRHIGLTSGIMVWGGISYDSKTPLMVL